MIVICLNGPINSGKSTIGRMLAELLPDAAFADGDDHDAPPEAPLAERIAHAVGRLERLIHECRRACLVLAYPLRDADYQGLHRAAQERGAVLLVATLAPPLAVALSDRGARKLTDGERNRIRAMYDEGYGERAFSDIVLSAVEAPETMAQRLAGWMQGKAAAP